MTALWRPGRWALVAAVSALLLGCGSRPARSAGVVAVESGVAGSIHVALGLPVDADPSDDVMLDHGEFVVSYNPSRLEPNWVAWRLVAEDLGTAHRSNDFHKDERLPTDRLRVDPMDYRGSGYDRGHLCPSADRTSSVAANRTTFVMTNIQPQAHALNVGPWERLETYERALVGQGRQVFIVAGGLFSAAGAPQMIGPGIAVPSASFKVLVVLQGGQGPADVTAGTTVYAVIMPNTAAAAGTRWPQYLVSVDEVERQSGYNFLSRVPEPAQTIVESRPAAAP
ncbi:MAG TPA: DNA/RNA non-specific endonuclease [Polyangia bacterium]|nr:DNA/RNA non-specific endonuclease [Polyangia bacterium]